MNDTLRAALTWLGGICAVSYIALGVWFTAASLLGGRHLDAKQGRRAPLTEVEIAAVDLGAEIAELLKEDTK
ncbi:hypothetical protein ACFXAW_07205 [Streptomyces sp. NPDC059445]|uniref:hypothetical protein n=1 Tax=Streptomyces sp. NPDC059445 TaxID=3346832 RepID=UPI0036B93FA9